MGFNTILRIERLNKKGEATLYFRIIKNRRKSFVATGIKIKPEYWDAKKEIVNKKHPHSVLLNTQIKKLEAAFQEGIIKSEIDDVSVSAKRIKEKILGGNDTDFFELANSIIQRHHNARSIGTRDKVKSIVNKILRFNNGHKLSIKDIDLGFLSKYETHCLVDLQNNQNTLNRDLIFIKQVINLALRNGYINQSDNVFAKYRIKHAKPIRATLTESELKKIEELELDNNLLIKKHRDMFIFACYAGGLRISDVLTLKWESIQDNQIHLTMRKTKHQTRIFLNKKASNILLKYETTKSKYVFDMINSFIDEKHHEEEIDRAITTATVLVNRSLKKIAHLAEIKKCITSHVARHTFATIALTKGIPLPTVQQIMGHANIRETQIYAKIQNDSIMDALKKFDD